MSKVILIDNGDFMFRAIMSWKAGNRATSIGYTYMNMIISCLKKIGVDPDDKIMVAVDSSSWRKDYCAEYKANRKEARDKQADEVPWDKIFKDFDELYLKLAEATNWQFVKDWGLEADDWIAYATKYYSEECIIVSRDADMKQLCARHNVKFFSTAIKLKGGKGGYAVVKNPYQIIAQKVLKGDVADNIICRDTDTDEDVKLRELIINLLELPADIEKKIKYRLDKLEWSEDVDISKIPFKSLAERYHQIYAKDKVLTIDDTIQMEERKKKKKAKADKEKREAKKKAKEEAKKNG